MNTKYYYGQWKRWNNIKKYEFRVMHIIAIIWSVLMNWPTGLIYLILCFEIQISTFDVKITDHKIEGRGGFRNSVINY